MKIMFIGTLASTVYGFRADLLRELVRQGHEVYACAVDYTPDAKIKVISMGVRPVDYTFDRAGLNPFKDVYNTYIFSKIIEKINPDIVFSYFAKPVIFGTFAAKMAKVNCCIGMLEGLGYVFTEQSSQPNFKLKLIKNITVFLYKLALPLLNNLIFLNHDDPKDLLEKYRIKVNKFSIVNGIGIDLKKYQYIQYKPKEAIRFIFIGRLLKEKGINEYVQAARILKNKYQNLVEFIILGGVDSENPGGLSMSDLQMLIDEQVCVYPGFVEDVPAWIASSSVFVLPSYREGLPRSTQEAMAIGRPIITTDVPGCRETIIHKENGLLIPPRNIDLLIEAMEYFIENPECIIKMGKASRMLVEQKYDVVKINQAMLTEMGVV